MYTRLLRTKPVGSMGHAADDLTELADGSPVGLAKVLTTVDLVSLGVGSCVGTGMYVVAGLVAKAMAGPGVILSFVIAAVASILSGETSRGQRFPSAHLEESTSPKCRYMIPPLPLCTITTFTADTLHG